jgi:hypothetical protein
MVTCLAETCRWLLDCIIKLTFIHSSVFVGAFKNVEYHTRARNKEHKLPNLAVFFRMFHLGFKWKIQAGAKATWHQRRLYWQYLTFIDYLKRSKCFPSTLIHCRSFPERLDVLRCLLSSVKAIPLQAWTGLLDSRRLRFPEFLDSRNMQMVRLSALRRDRLYPPLSLAIISVRCWVDPNGVVSIVNKIFLCVAYRLL